MRITIPATFSIGGYLLLGLMSIVPLVGLAAEPDKAAGQRTYSEAGGTLADGTRYLMRVPSNWNGTVIRDLDYVTIANGHRYLHMLELGYAVAGTARHERRWVGNYDTTREIRHLNTVLDIFLERFGKPKRVIQYGCSGGGTVGLIMAEGYLNRVDGVVAGGTHAPMWLMNTWLDYWFVLQALLAPNEPIVNLQADASLQPAHPQRIFAWRQVLNAAQRTPHGRARIALAITIGQLPYWVNPTMPNPDRNDLAAVQQSMYQSAIQFADSVGGVTRFMFESAIGPKVRQVSWNTEVDYREFFENGNALQKKVVRQLYKQAGLDLDADLQRVNAAPRLSADAEALEYWGAEGRTSVGKPQIPVLRFHDIGDSAVPVSNVQGYNGLVRENGKEDLYRTVFTRGPTHCDHTAAEQAALIQTMMHRLDSDRWGSTDSESLNKLGRSLDPSSASRFTSIDGYTVEKYNRTWVPDWAR